MSNHTINPQPSRIQHYILGVFALFAFAPAFVFFADHSDVRMGALVADVSGAFSEEVEPCPEDEPPEACPTEDTGAGDASQEDEEETMPETQEESASEEDGSEVVESKKTSESSKTVVVKNFTVSGSEAPIISGATTTIAWDVENTKGVNLIFSCNKTVIPLVFVGEDAVRAPCEIPLFTGVLAPKGSVSVIFSSSSKTAQTIMVRLAPQGSDGDLHPSLGKLINLSLAPVKFTRSLAPELTHPEVRLLQEYLKKHPDLYPEGKVTGIYGPATQAGVKRLQEKYGLGNAKTPGFGSVGLRTRALLNYLTSK